jgi:pSer/pThr/pTyr-binding forkhead associated (FHA) protein
VDVQLDIDNVSRNHASIVRSAHGWILRDLDSTNGTFVNELPIRERLLRDGDQIRIAAHAQVPDQRQRRGAVPRRDLPADDAGRPDPAA